MEFHADKINEFLSIFESAQPKIAAFPGCREVKLYQDAGSANIRYTHSIWDSEAALENYRQSSLFVTTWAKTKVLFAEKAQAFSLI
jgi:heme-degrading monooxygenase HmoA